MTRLYFLFEATLCSTTQSENLTTLSARRGVEERSATPQVPVPRSAEDTIELDRSSSV